LRDKEKKKAEEGDSFIGFFWVVNGLVGQMVFFFYFSEAKECTCPRNANEGNDGIERSEG
jgi:hypothetical protein